MRLKTFGQLRAECSGRGEVFILIPGEIWDGIWDGMRNGMRNGMWNETLPQTYTCSCTCPPTSRWRSGRAEEGWLQLQEAMKSQGGDLSHLVGMFV